MKAKYSLRGLLCPKNRRKELNLPLKTTLILLLISLIANTLFGQVKVRITGKVTTATDHQPLQGATVKTDKSPATIQTDQNGNFSITTTQPTGKLIISYIGYKTVEVQYSNSSKGPFQVELTSNENTLNQVTVSTGFQTLPKERATGSFSVVNNELFNRSVSTDVISRLNGVTSGLLFDSGTLNNQLGISIRGRSTILANAQPLIVLDNFPYEGDLNNINPNDIESVTVLKDAAAASIWGTKAGNGVIVITTKRGKFNQPLKVSLNANVKIGEKPDLFYSKTISPADFIEVEKFRFDKGMYNSYITDGYTALTPAVEIMIKAKAGTITPAESENQLKALSRHDVRNDLLKYFYRESVSQQYALNLSGGSDIQQYYVSGGWDKNLSNTVGNQYGRISLNANNTYSLLNHKLEINTGMIYTKTNTENNSVSPQFGNSSLYPYAALADNDGNALPIARYRESYLKNANSGLLDWGYRPLDELRLSDNAVKGTDYQATLGLKYKIIPALSIELKYRYGNGTTNSRDHATQETYRARNLINTYTQVNAATGALTRPVPIGDLLDLSNTNYTSQNLRGQLNYNNKWGKDHNLSAIAGAEIGDVKTGSNGYSLYGYDPNRETSLPVDLVGTYKNYITGSSIIIPSGLSMTSLTNRTLSFYGNAAYTFKSRYTLSASVRNDGSNLFGVATNQKWAPLWSAGTGWTINEESFYSSKLLPNLKLRATYGYNGNVDKSITAYLTTKVVRANRYGAIYSNITNPPNADLRWERVGQFNAGLDFGFINDILRGSIEYYRKSGKDLIGDAILLPSTGYTSYRGNTAAIRGRGVDISLNSSILRGRLKWDMMGTFAYAASWITDYKKMPASNSDYVYGTTPLVGESTTAFYVYKWAGLDPLTGDPQGYLDGVLSKDYSKIVNSTNVADLVNKGSATPLYFGNFLNTISYNGISVSFNLIYKLGYYFNKESVNYSYLLSGSSGTGHSDYAKRWQKPGDEKITNVPSMLYPNKANRDSFYNNSEAVVEKGDHIRLQDIQLSYELNKRKLPGLPFNRVKVYLYASNLGVLWKANHAGLDPDAGAYPQPKSVAAGLQFDL